MLKRFICKILGHKYYMVEKYSNNVQKLKCHRCNKVFGINHDVRAVIELDLELENSMRLIYPEKFKK